MSFRNMDAESPVRNAGQCRVLFLVGELHTGGLERQLYYLLRTLDRSRYQSAVAVWNFRETDVHVRPIRELGVPIYPLSDAHSRLEKLAAFRRLVRQLDPEVVHSYTFYTNFAATWGTVGTRATAVGSVRSAFGYAKEDSGAIVGRLSARWPAYQVFNSDSAAQSARQSRSVFSPKFPLVVRNGLDLERFQPRALADEWPAQILGIGYLLPVKRWERLLRAARYLKAQGVPYRIRIAGDGPQRSNLEQAALELGVADSVEFVSHSDDIPGLLARSSFLVHTADSEGCPNAVMEAMACGRAVVATDVGDIPALVDHGVTGFVVPSHDERALAEHIVRLIGDRELCVRMGAAARAKAERDFGLDKLVRETLNAYAQAGWKNDEGDGQSMAARIPAPWKV